MLKKYAFKKITIATLALLILGLLYLFPKSEKEFYVPTTITYDENIKTAIYLIDKNDYVARTNIINKNKDVIESAKYLINCLTINSQEEIYIPYSFSAIIPKNTKVKEISLDEGLLKIDFSKEFNNISKENEEKMISSIVYTMTTINGINEVMIFVDGNILNKLPISNKQIPNILDKSYGINKIYNIDNIKNTTQVTSYYLSKTNDQYYYVPITSIQNSNQEKIEIIIKQLKSKPITETNLLGFLHTNTELVDYEILNDSINLSFNNYILDDLTNETILEEVKYSIAYSINDTYGINNINYSIHDKKIEQLMLN